MGTHRFAGNDHHGCARSYEITLLTMSNLSESTIAKDSVVQSASALRRIGAIVYDALLVAALLMLTTALFLLFTRGRIASDLGWVFYVYRVALVTVVTAFFVFFWTEKGRTLGMQAWRLRIERLDGSLPTVRDALLRLLLALIPWLPALVAIVIGVQLKMPLATRVGYWLFVLVPVNYASARFDVSGRSWHDRFLQTRIRFNKN
jgi:uncharacterized RDD family membrane protein YckC